MTDGPLRSLSMDSKWRAVARKAENANFSPEEVAEVMRLAVLNEIDLDVVYSVDKVLTDSASLFYSDGQGIIDQLELLRYGCPGTLVSEMIDVACDLVRSGRAGRDVSQAALTVLIEEVSPRFAREIQEHWVREGTQRSARWMRDRLNASQRVLGSSDMSNSILTRTLTTRVTKQSDLNDGVSL